MRVFRCSFDQRVDTHLRVVVLRVGEVAGVSVLGEQSANGVEAVQDAALQVGAVGQHPAAVLGADNAREADAADACGMEWRWLSAPRMPITVASPAIWYRLPHLRRDGRRVVVTVGLGVVAAVHHHPAKGEVHEVAAVVVGPGTVVAERTDPGVDEAGMGVGQFVVTEAALGEIAARTSANSMTRTPSRKFGSGTGSVT
ncbi:MAG TPA: hypothetical protein VGL26_01565 [Jatrophihabitans sp.]|jgi:hypothetical protein